MSAKAREKTYAQKALERIHVLIMDSSPQLTDLYKDILLQFGFTHVFTANDGWSGVQILKEMRIDLIFTDWELKVFLKSNTGANDNPGKAVSLTGIQFAQRLRNAPTSPNPFIPVIMMTEQVTGAQFLDAINAGVNETLVKPVDARRLCERMKAVIDKPRIFVTAETYKGPCRRRQRMPLPVTQPERRKKEVRIVRYNKRAQQSM